MVLIEDILEVPRDCIVNSVIPKKEIFEEIDKMKSEMESNLKTMDSLYLEINEKDEEINKLKQLLELMNIKQKQDIEKINKENPLYLNSQNTYRKTILKKLKEKNNGKKLKEELEPENDVFPELCEEDMFVDEFLNLNEVKNKLKVFDPSIRWVQCNGNLNYELGNSFDFYSETMKQFPDLKVWVFSGTEDGVLPTLGDP